MEKLMILLLFCHKASAGKIMIYMFYIMMSSGNPNIPDYFIMANFEEVVMVYYDTNMKTLEPRHDWARRLMVDDPQHWDTISEDGIHYEQVFRVDTDSFKQDSNQTGGVHIIQQYWGCEWDNETEKLDGFLQYGYNGEDFLTFDRETETWTAANPRAETTKLEWDGDTTRTVLWTNLLAKSCPAWLKKYFIYTNGLLQIPERPSVSLLQKTPSSPVSCHATGFYPHRAVMFWRKDGEELYEDVDQGEILPNHDETFQMSVYLNLSSINPEDWRRYDCVFQLSGVTEETVTALHKPVIRTNWEKTGIGNDQGDKHTLPIIVAVVVLVILISIIGFTVHKKKTGERLRGFYCNTEATCVSERGLVYQSERE
uniref:Ig-like domain-containing protein n=1 Tax=Seriola lalandi dorsalis TaxID=1841481 RepID=A0A3B4X8G6_SERLL